MDFKNFNWISGIFIITYHILLFILLPVYFVKSGMPSKGLAVTTVFLCGASLFSVTAGYHRLYSHRAYKISKVAEWMMFPFGLLATQGSVLQWAYDHRNHHHYVDTDKDPYNIKEGFWHAHMGWLFYNLEKIDNRVVSDLVKNKLVMFQHRYYGFLITAVNALTILALGFAFGDFFGAFVFGFLLRIFLAHHVTWSINSFVHLWGKQPYSKNNTAVDNWLFALITFGEGYHNYHHTFATDYRNGVKWWQFDPTKWLIWGLSKAGFAWDLHRIGKYAVTRKIIREDARHRMQLLQKSMSDKREHFHNQVQILSERLHNKINQIQEARVKYKSAAKQKRKEYKEQIRLLKKEFKKDWRKWSVLSKQITALV